MYIEFQLPSGAGGAAAGYALETIKRAMAEWAEKYDVSYRTKVHKYTFRISLESEEQYTLFQISWDPDTSYLRTYRLIKTEH